MLKFEHANFEVKAHDEDTHCGKFVLEPLERGFGTTIGNALRRVLLSSLPGAAVYSIKIDNVFHEFTALNGVEEDVTGIILNLKELVMTVRDDETYILRISQKGPKVVTASDIACPDGVEIISKDLVIANLAKDGTLDMEIRVQNGRGYVGADTNKTLFSNSSLGYGAIFTDSLYSPVENVTFSVDPTRFGQSVKYEKVTIEVETNGSIQAVEAISMAAKILSDHLAVVANLDEITANMESLMNETSIQENTNHKVIEIEQLDLSVRSYNCLKRAGITTVDDLTDKTEDELSRVKNLGKKSLKEIKEKLAELEFTFKRYE
ncbi:MAG: DNA-directed RNA polymerase subunit alpha [Erysipelotrichaceae bacterium]